VILGFGRTPPARSDPPANPAGLWALGTATTNEINHQTHPRMNRVGEGNPCPPAFASARSSTRQSMPQSTTTQAEPDHQFRLAATRWSDLARAPRHMERSMTSSASTRAARSAFSLAGASLDVEPSCPDAHGAGFEGPGAEVDPVDACCKQRERHMACARISAPPDFTRTASAPAPVCG
jgi:hypothetical protein